jgi:hypothetical protein
MSFIKPPTRDSAKEDLFWLGDEIVQHCVYFGNDGSKRPEQILKGQETMRIGFFRNTAYAFLLQTLIVSSLAISGNIDLPYGGRFVEDNGAPVTGPVDIIVEFFSSETNDSPLADSLVFQAVALEDGVFQLNFSLNAHSFNEIFRAVDKPVWIQITDATNGKTYPRQLQGAIPYALKVPVDGVTIGWNEAGELALRGDASVSKVAGESFITSGATSGQVLAWDKTAKVWKPANVATGTVTSISAGAGLSGGTILGQGTLGIADAGVTTTMLADGSVTSAKIAAGSVVEASLVDQSVTSIKIKDKSVGLVDLDPGACTANQVISYSSGASAFVCSNVGSGSGDIVNNGQNGAVRIGTDDGSSLTLETNNVPAVTVDTAGKVGIGTTSPTANLEIATTSTETSTNQIGQKVVVIHTPSAPSTAQVYGTFSQAYFNDLGTGFTGTSYVGVYGLGARGSASAAVATLTGVEGNAQASSGSTVANAYGLKGSIFGSTFTSNVIANGYAGYFSTTASGSDTITNGYGVFIGTIGGATNKWSLYINDATAPSYFAGNVGIGTTAPGSALEVAGQVKITGGVPGAGKVLTSDGVGLASWAAPTAGAVSGLSAAMSSQTLANANFSQTWNWDSVTAGSGLNVGSNSVTSGTLFNTASTSTAMTGTLGNFVLSGDNAANTGSVLKATVAGVSSAAVPLMITNGGTGLSFRVNDSGSDSDATPFVVDNAGNVGIGTTAPVVTLDVKSSSSGQVKSFAARSNPGGTGGSNQNEVVLDNLYGAGNFKNQISLSSQGVEKWSLGNDASSAGVQDFFIYDEFAAATRLFINPSGNVGIGTTTPGGSLQIGGTYNFIFANDGPGSAPQITTNVPTGFGLYFKPSNGSTIFTGPSNVNPVFQVQSTGTADTMRFVGYPYGSVNSNLIVSTGDYAGNHGGDIKLLAGVATIDYATRFGNFNILLSPSGTGSVQIPNGNVGIGITDPGAKLDIAGTVKIVDGSQGNGKVLTSDAAGLASWNTPSAGAVSGLAAATAIGAIDNTNFAQSWNWSTATTQSPMTMAANALTTGSLLNITSSNGALNSTNGLLNVANTSASTTGAVARIQSNSTAGSGLTVLANGNIGIGTTAPNATLAVTSASDFNAISLSNTNTDATNKGAVITGSRKTNANVPFSGFGTFDSGAVRDVYIGGGGWSRPDATRILFTTAAAYNETNDQGVERMRITAAGYVGIGTTAPVAPLEVLKLGGTTGFTDILAINQNSDSTGRYGSLAFYQGITNVGARITSGNPGNEDGYLAFETRQSMTAGTSTTEHLRIDRDGNVGIGTTAPAYTLDVAGNFRSLVTNTVATTGINYINLINDTYTPASAPVAGTRPIAFGAEIRTAGAADLTLATVQAADNVALHQTTATLGQLTAVTNYAANISTGTINSGTGSSATYTQTTGGSTVTGAGVSATASNTSTGNFTTGIGLTAAVTNSGAGTITTARGLDTKVTLSAGTITNGYGLYVGNIQATNKWSVYANDATAPSYFAGNVGIGTTAPLSKLHVLDGSILADGTTGTTPTSGAGTRMMWIPSKGAFRAGVVYSTEWDTANVGVSSFAAGDGTKASGAGSVAMGGATIASGYRSIALGDGATASPQSSELFAAN